LFSTLEVAGHSAGRAIEIERRGGLVSVAAKLFEIKMCNCSFVLPLLIILLALKA